jgi:tetratricopeptide (TPR) repeat protein
VIQPVIVARRASGEEGVADSLEHRFGSLDETPEVVDDDEVIIVEIDGDELGDVSVEDFAAETVEIGDVDVAEIVARAGSGETGDSSRASKSVARDADELLAEALADSGSQVEAVDSPPEVVDEELVEISTAADGPSFNELAQLDLFIDQGLYDDARVMLERLERDFPDDPDLRSRRSALQAAGVAPEIAPVAQVNAPSSAEAGAKGPAEEIFDKAEEIFDKEEGIDYIDLARELEEELAEEEAMVEEATGRGKGEALLDEVFKEFQRGVAEQLSEEDSDTHFNLGIAYKEMGLLDEAIAEFEIAAHDPDFFVEACSMIGVCANDLGRPTDAAEWYQKALVAPDLTPDARTALRYELASALEQTGEIEQALDLFQEIVNHDPEYRDVGARLAVLSQQRQVN